MKSDLFIFYFYGQCCVYSALKNICLLGDHKAISLCFLLEDLLLCHSGICLELIIVHSVGVKDL